MQNINKMQNFLRTFFENSETILNTGGEIQVTIKMTEPYIYWDLEKLAEETGKLKLVKICDFNPKKFIGYTHRSTLKTALNSEITKSENKTFIFKRLLSSTSDIA